MSIFRNAARFPPLEITSCEYCEYLIPLNMFHIHQVLLSNSKRLILILNLFKEYLQQKLDISSQ